MLPSNVRLSTDQLSTVGKVSAAYAGPNPEEAPPGCRAAPSDFRIGMNPFANVELKIFPFPRTSPGPLPIISV